MNKLEKYAAKRIICINEKMDRISTQIQIEFKKPEAIIDFSFIQQMNQEYTDYRVELHEIACCLLDQPSDDLPF